MLQNNLSLFLISKFRRVVNVVVFHSGDSPASEFYVPTFRNTLPVPPMKLEQAAYSETSEDNIQKPPNYPKKEYNKLSLVVSFFEL